MYIFGVAVGFLLDNILIRGVVLGSFKQKQYNYLYNVMLHMR